MQRSAPWQGTLNNEKEATMSSGTHQPKKRPYEKPRLRAIDLAAEEVLATGCKTAVKIASGAAPCYANNCSLPGS
jgi:hypothetical protein